jgi:uncharacterized protein
MLLAIVSDTHCRALRRIPASCLERMRARFPDADAVVFGHSHMPLHERRGDFQIFNPGSPTQRRRAPAHTMGFAHLAGAGLRLELVRLD